MKLQEIIIGTPVTYWRVIKVSGEKWDPVETEITSEPWEASGNIICKVKGISGGVCITHLEKRL